MNTELLQISFRLMTEKTFSHSMKSSLLISDVKALIETDSEIAPENQRLIFKGQLLKDEFTLKSYGVESGSTIHVVGRAIKPLEQDSSNCNTQIDNNNESETVERSEAAGFEGQGSGSRGLGMPMGVFMSPIYATISVSTPVTPNTTDNSMEQVASQFFSGVVNSLLTSFNNVPLPTTSQNNSTVQNSQPQNDLVNELEDSTEIIKNITQSIKLLNDQNTVSSDISTTNNQNDVTITTLTNVITTNDSLNPISTIQNNAANVYSNINVLNTENVTNTQKNNSHDSEQVNNESNTVNFNNRSNSLKDNYTQIDENNYESYTNIKQTTKRSNSEPIELDNLSIKFNSSNEILTEELNEKSTSYQSNKSDHTNECDEFKPRREKVRLMDPELITSKLPWSSLYKLEQHVYELNYGFSINYSDSLSYSNGDSGCLREGPFIKRPSFTKVELSSPCYLSDEPLSLKTPISSTENMELSKRLIETDDTSNLDEFLSRLEAVNTILNETMNRYDSGDRKTQTELYKQLSYTMAIKTKIYASLCSIFSWMHTQMLSPEVARILATRMGWNGSGTATPQLQRNTQNTQSNFTFSTYSTYVTRDQSNNTDNTQPNNANDTNSIINNNDQKMSETTDSSKDLTASNISNDNSHLEDITIAFGISNGIVFYYTYKTLRENRPKFVDTGRPPGIYHVKWN